MGFKLLPPSEEVQDLVREVILDHRGAFQDAANLLGWKRATLDSHLNSYKVKTLNWDAIKAVHAVTHDRRLWPILVGAGFVVLPDPATLKPSADFEKEAGDVHISTSALQAKAREYKDNDGSFSLQELEDLEADAGVVLKEVCDLLALIDALREDFKK